MDVSSGDSEADFTGGDWSPRISFSHSFACIQRVPSPTKKNAFHDSEFEFSRSVDADLLTADELFCNGKLRPLKISPRESSDKVWKTCSQRGQELHIMESGPKKGAQAVAEIIASSRKEDSSSVCEEDSISTWEGKTQFKAGAPKSFVSGEVPIFGCRRAEKEEIAKKPGSLTAPTINNHDLPSMNKTEVKLEDGKVTTGLRSHTNRGGLTCACNPEMSRKSGKAAGSPPISRKELMSVCKQEMGKNAGKLRLPIDREEPIPACKLEISSKADRPHSRTSREDVLLASTSVENPELNKKAGEIRLPTGRQDSLPLCSASRSLGKGGMPGRWKEEVQWAKRNEKDEHGAGSEFRRFTKHPRSASMIVEGSCKLDNRSACVSLENSRCPSPTRSFSLPATTPASPSASNSFPGFSSSSLSPSSRYRSKIKDFFKLKKLTVPKDGILPPIISSSSSTCRLPISPRSLLAFFKTKESDKAGSKHSSSMDKVTQQAHEHVYASNKDLYSGARRDDVATSKNLSALPQTDITFSLNNKPSSCLTLSNSAKTPPQPSFPFPSPPSSTPKAAVSIRKTPQHSAEFMVGSKLRASRSFSHEKVLGIDGPTMLVLDGRLWQEGNSSTRHSALKLHTNGPGIEGNQRSNKQDMGNMMMVGSKGGPVRTRGSERPLPYTSSVKIAPVLNVPSCITPSLRKAKSSSKPRSFSFENLFGRRERALITPTYKSSEG